MSVKEALSELERYEKETNNSAFFFLMIVNYNCNFFIRRDTQEKFTMTTHDCFGLEDTREPGKVYFSLSLLYFTAHIHTFFILGNCEIFS